MISYQEFEMAVYDSLMKKRKSDNQYNFSVRQKASKGAEKDYFIGTEKSKYFGTTFWYVKVGFPGSSGDLINVFFFFTSNSNLSYYIEFNQTNSPVGEQNKLALELIKKLEPIVEKQIGLSKKSKPSQRIHSYKTESKKPEYDSPEELMSDVYKDLQTLIPLVNKEIDNIKEKQPDFIAHQFSDERFEEMQNKRNLRLSSIDLEKKDKTPLKDIKAFNEGFRPQILPLNKILFGPPGTGKTYRLKDEFFNLYEEKETSITPEQNFKEVTKDMAWWQAIALDLIELEGTAKVGQLLEGRWLKKVIETSTAKNIRAQIWGNLQSHTIEESTTVNFKRRLPPFIFNKSEDSVWSILSDNVQEQCPEILELKEKVDHFQPKSDKIISRYVFTTFHQAFAYEDFIEGIKPVMSEDTDGEVAYHIEDGVFKKICKRAEQDPENKYAIFIDEINRGNIANIFGELITLIETNKRKGMTDAISVTLPYSKQSFTVPSNIDIYGTMNTADRSIEALDSALRRRFVFEELMPNYKVFDIVLGSSKIWQGIDLSILLKTINERIEVLIDRDHQIGHAYFLTLKGLSAEQYDLRLKSIFVDQIIPLLQEYFYNDYVKIGMVLGSGFIETVKTSQIKFAKIEGSVESDYNDFQIYRFKDDLHSENFDLRTALDMLITPN
jgi:5-methylcytosine-specific restriction protein B